MASRRRTTAAPKKPSRVVLVPASYTAPEHYKCRVRFVDGTRPWVHLDPGLTEAQAAIEARALQLRARREEWVSNRTARTMGIEPAPTVRRETWDEYMPRWFAYKRSRGLTSVHDMESHYRTHIAPVIGTLFCDATTPRDCRRLVEALERKITDGYTDTRGRFRKMSAKSAINVWSTFTSAVGDAVSSNREDLAILQDRANPTADVRGPDDSLTAEREKNALYPSELLSALGCARWSIELRRMLAVSVYLYLRAGELDTLEWRDVDLDHGVVHIRRAMQANGEIGPPKNGKSRRVPIEPPLLPLLAAMRAEAVDSYASHGTTHSDVSAVRLFASVPKAGKLAKYLRELLRDAGVTRDVLFTSDATNKQIGWHDATRATGITWRIARGDRHAEVRDDAGHQSVTTTEKYDRTAGLMRKAMVEVFPPLPPALLAPTTADGPKWTTGEGGGERKRANSRANNQWRRRESKTAEDATPRSAAEIPVESAAPPAPDPPSDDARSREMDHGGPPRSEPSDPRSPDLAAGLRAQAHEAIEAGDMERARKLLDAIAALTPAPLADVRSLAVERARRGR